MHGLPTLQRMNEAEMAAYGIRMDKRLAGIKLLKAARMRLFVVIGIVTIAAVYNFIIV